MTPAGSSPWKLRLVEPQMEGLFHAPFNAALLHAVALAYPDAVLSFMASAGHLDKVREILNEHAPALTERITWMAEFTQTGSSLPARWWSSRQRLRRLLATGETLLFCSISRMQLLLLKQNLRPENRVACVLHGDLESVETPTAEGFPKNLFALRRVLEQAQPEGLRFLLLSESIQCNLPPSVRQSMGTIGVIDHPYHFPAALPASPPGDVVLGIFGNTGSARALETVARKVKQSRPEVRFRLIGFVEDEATVARIADVIEDATATPISRIEFKTRAESITHALWLAEPGGFRLRASGTFFDALAYLKPLIYTENPYLDGYRLAEAGVGTTCRSLEEVVAAVLSLADAARTIAFPEQYKQQVDALRNLRRQFTPQALAERLPGALGW